MYQREMTQKLHQSWKNVETTYVQGYELWCDPRLLLAFLKMRFCLSQLVYPRTFLGCDLGVERCDLGLERLFPLSNNRNWCNSSLKSGQFISIKPQPKMKLKKQKLPWALSVTFSLFIMLRIKNHRQSQHMMRMSVVEGDIDSAFHFFCSCVAQDTTMQHISKLGLLHNFFTVKDGLVSLKQTV